MNVLKFVELPVENDRIWMTIEELEKFNLFQLETSKKLNIVLEELCLFLLEKNKIYGI
jgi:hypothetical protein